MSEARHDNGGERVVYICMSGGDHLSILCIPCGSSLYLLDREPVSDDADAARICIV